MELSGSSITLRNDTPENEARVQAFSRDGYLFLRNVLPMDHVQHWSHQWADPSLLESLLHQVYLVHLKSNGSSSATSSSVTDDEATETRSFAMQPGVKHGFREIVMRSPGRYEISLQSLTSICTRSLLDIVQEHLPWVPFLLHQPTPHSTSNPMTWKDVNIVNVSLVISTPGATDQKWHADGGHVDLHEHLPCHCANLFIPLCPITEENGPTELRPGTHFFTRQLVPMMLAAKAKKTLAAPVTPLLQLGDVLIFDYRLLHRGRANRSPSHNRVILVVTVAVPWFRDVLNFPHLNLYAAETIT
jgi:Phytanoyl-CoA dioxygenase (PhyH)